MTDLTHSMSHDELEELDLPSSETDFQEIEAPRKLPKAEPLVVTVPTFSGFDYSGVSKAVAKEAEATAERIRNRHRASIIDTGNDLVVIKKKLEHGQFGSWLSYHFGMSERTAQNYMNAADAFGSVPKVIDLLPPTIVYKLAAKGAPKDVKQFVIKEVVNGARLDHKEIEARIASAQSDERKRRENERAAKHEESAWNNQEETLRTAGKSDDEIEGERKRWATNRERDAQLKSSETKQREEATLEPEAKMKQVAAHAATILRARLGNDYEKFRDAFLQIDFNELKAALMRA